MGHENNYEIDIAKSRPKSYKQISRKANTDLHNDEHIDVHKMSHRNKITTNKPIKVPETTPRYIPSKNNLGRFSIKPKNSQVKKVYENRKKLSNKVVDKYERKILKNRKK